MTCRFPMMIYFCIYINFRLEPSNTCSHKITNIIYERLEPNGFNWKAVSEETKAFYFEEFKVILLNIDLKLALLVSVVFQRVNR